MSKVMKFTRPLDPESWDVEKCCVCDSFPSRPGALLNVHTEGEEPSVVCVKCFAAWAAERGIDIVNAPIVSAE